MKLTIKPIKKNEEGNNVRILHQVLALLGFPVAKTELNKQLAGTSTLRQTRHLQRQLGVRVVDNNILLDENSIEATIKTLNKKGLLSSERTFEISGTVKLNNGSVKKQQLLVAFDLDLKAVTKFRTLKNLKEARGNGGFEYLAEVITDNKGRYSTSFFDWQYQRAERKLADVQRLPIGCLGSATGLLTRPAGYYPTASLALWCYG